jgi:uncharacterized repeat protein (TIGR03806 family)
MTLPWIQDVIGLAILPVAPAACPPAPPRVGLVATALLLVAAIPEPGRPYGLDRRPDSTAFLSLPRRDAPFPARLSETGAFRDVRSLTPADALIPYDLIAPFWSDGAEKSRWVALPNDRSGPPARIRVGADGEWTFPPGTVFVKHFALAVDESRPEARRRLETRLLVVDGTGIVRGATYRWRPDGSDADIVSDPLAEAIPIRTAAGGRTQPWSYPGPADCRQCHTPASGGVLGVKARQLNREFAYRGGVVDNQLRTWAHLDLFDPPIAETEIPRLPRLARLDDADRSLEDRARSYLDANCAHCHRPGGAAADFDARFTTPLASQRLIGEPARINLGIDGARAIAPNDPWRSAVLTRMETHEPVKMPPLAHNVVDARGAALIRAWIASLPGPPVVAPPMIRPRGGDFPGPVRVTLSHPDPDAVIRYTLDGSAPGKSSPAYAGPIALDRSTTVRARAYKPDWTRSITVQETFILGD